jgi:hypothetical protein
LRKTELELANVRLEIDKVKKEIGKTAKLGCVQ